MNFFEKVFMGGAVAGAVVSSPDAKAGEVQKENPVNKNQTEVVADHKDVAIDSKTFVVGSESNEAKEKEFNLKLAQEALSHVGKGAYISELSQFKGYVLMSEQAESAAGGSFANEKAVQIKAYEVSENIDSYKIIRISFDGGLDENTDVKISNRMNHTNPIQFSSVYSILREKTGPQEIQALVKQANSKINLIQNLESAVKGSSDTLNLMAINDDLKVLKGGYIAER